MLVLSRKRDQAVIIDDTIRVTVVDIRGDYVRLGIATPHSMPVHRTEVRKVILGEKDSIQEQQEQYGYGPVSSYSGKPKGSLILSRRNKESISIASDVIVEVVDIRGDKVRLGIEAPKEIMVHRLELYETIQPERNKSERGEAEEREQVLNDALDDVVEEFDDQTPIAGPLQIYIDSTAYSPEEKGELLSLISELYQLQTDDRLVIDSTGTADLVPAVLIGGPDG